MSAPWAVIAGDQFITYFGNPVAMADTPQRSGSFLVPDHQHDGCLSMSVSKRLRYEILRRDNHTVTSVLPRWEPNASRYRHNRPIRIEPVRHVNERWLPVVGYEGLYEVSDHAAVRSTYRTVIDSRGFSRVFLSHLLRPTYEGNPGYAMVSLYRNGKHRYFRVHTLVANAFIGPRPPGMEVAHEDGNPSYSCLRNLRYATPAENQADRIKHGTSNRGQRHPNVVLSDLDVLTIDTLLRDGTLQRVIANKFHIARTTVSAISTGRSWGQLTGRENNRLANGQVKE